ncbi:unnamed protein product [Prorocentrum cordatum]|uniref:WWE domain-containing protein n=1 Tax=Prorocentrum cordatum TaxID=2364126 RepID=A0ABN9UNY5_9DINO|nr:unnamed protein product [Polarella glacialis]
MAPVMTSSAPPPRAAPRTTSGGAARRARLRATHARKAQQASHRLAGLLAAGPPPGLCCDDVACFYAKQHAFEEQYAFEEQHAVTEHFAELGHCEFVADAVLSYLGDADGVEQRASGETFINEGAGDNQAPAISDREPVASQLRIDSASPKQELPPSEEPSGDPQQLDEVLRQCPPLDFVRALQRLERELAVKEFMAMVPTESTDMQDDLPTVDSKGLNDTACENQVCIDLQRPDLGGADKEVIDWRAEADEQPLEQPVVEAFDKRVEDHPLSDNKELSDTTCGVLEPAKKDAVDPCGETAMEQTARVCDTTCEGHQYQWRVCGIHGEWEDFISCDNFGDNEALEARYQRFLSGRSDAKIKMKLKTHLFKVDFRNMSLRAVNRNGLGARLRLCRDLL